MKITIVAGARPNFMKIAPITRAIEAARALGKSISYRLVYTGRKDDTSLDASLFSDLDMKAPDVYLGVESSNPTSLTAGIMIACSGWRTLIFTLRRKARIMEVIF